MTRFRNAVHAVLHAFYHAISTAAALLRSLIRAVWMVTPPPFCRDWQANPPAVPGTPAPEPKPPESAVGGILIGMLLATTLPAGQIMKVLPRGVSLPPGVKPEDQYPASIAFGFQDQVRPARYPGLPGADYLEFAVGVADLVLQPPDEGFTGPCAILGRLDLNELLPIVLGRLLGLQKVLRAAHTKEDSFRLLNFWTRSLVAPGSLQLTGEPVRASECAPLAPLAQTFQQAVVSRSIFGTLAFTRFAWHWDRGVAQPIACDVTIAQGLGEGRYVYPQADASTRPCSGAWQIRVPWTMEAFQKASSFIPDATEVRPPG